MRTGKGTIHKTSIQQKGIKTFPFLLFAIKWCEKRKSHILPDSLFARRHQENRITSAIEQCLKICDEQKKFSSDVKCLNNRLDWFDTAKVFRLYVSWHSSRQGFSIPLRYTRDCDRKNINGLDGGITALVHVQKTVQSDGGGATHLLNAQVSPCTLHSGGLYS